GTKFTGNSGCAQLGIHLVSHPDCDIRAERVAPGWDVRKPENRMHEFVALDDDAGLCAWCGRSKGCSEQVGAICASRALWAAVTFPAGGSLRAGATLRPLLARVAL